VHTGLVRSKIVFSLIITGALLLAGNPGNTAYSQIIHDQDTTLSIKYTCPMHPEVISDTPGKCPKCGMNLVKFEDDDNYHKNDSIRKMPQKMKK
jgi:hypothetical protein